MTMTLPLRLMTLHFSQIGLTDGLTFMGVSSLFKTVRDPTAGQVVRGQFHGHSVAGQNTDEVHPNLSGDVR
jgi:hypothetical protein